MVRVRPFAPLRPVPSLASRVASPPYDVVDRQEAERLAAGNPWCFLHVSRSEIDLPAGTDPYGEVVYRTAAAALARLRDEGVLVRDGEPGLFLYRLVLDGRAQAGLVCCCHVDDYRAGVIRRHEKTRADKEDDRTRHILATRAHTGLVLMAYRDVPEHDALARREMNARPLYHFNAPDGVTHTMWRTADPQAWCRLFAAVPCAYIADGHHRIAASARAAERLHGAAGGDPECDWVLAALFPAGSLTILPYNRSVLDLGGRAPQAVLRDLGAAGRVSETGDPRPGRPGAFCFYMDGRWRRLDLDPATIDRGDPLGSLDVALLQERVLGPVLGIGDPRRDPRLEFVGGRSSTEELKRRVDAGRAAVGFSLHPTSMEQLMTASDAGLIMPPKSTWFEPKLRSGLLVHEIGSGLDAAPSGGAGFIPAPEAQSRRQDA
jgi:uncharacterized protein (DUF1015 family)